MPEAKRTADRKEQDERLERELRRMALLYRLAQRRRGGQRVRTV